jgi:hypothetical protein
MQRFMEPSRPKLGAVTCRNLKTDLENVNMDLFLNMQKWLKVHGKVSVATGCLLLPTIRRVRAGD